jgi:hypothetical protein
MKMKKIIIATILSTCLLIACNSKEEKKDTAAKTAEISDVDTNTGRLDGQVFIANKVKDKINKESIQRFTDYEDMNSAERYFGSFSSTRGGFIYFSIYRNNMKQYHEGLKVNFLNHQSTDCASHFERVSFRLLGKDSLLSYFKCKIENDDCWVCISKTSSKLDLDGGEYPLGIFVNVFSEVCGNRDCSIEEICKDVNFKKCMVGVTNYESFIQAIKKYKGPNN